MFSILTKGCHVGYSWEFVGTVYCIYGQSNTTIITWQADETISPPPYPKERPEVNPMNSLEQFEQKHRIQCYRQNSNGCTDRWTDKWIRSSLCTLATTQAGVQWVDGLVQNWRISIVNAMEILQSCTKPSIWWSHDLPQWSVPCQWPASGGCWWGCHGGQPAINVHTTYHNVVNINVMVNMGSTQNIDGLAQNCSNSSVLAMELLQSCHLAV